MEVGSSRQQHTVLPRPGWLGCPVQAVGGLHELGVTQGCSGGIPLTSMQQWVRRVLLAQLRFWQLHPPGAKPALRRGEV